MKSIFKYIVLNLTLFSFLLGLGILTSCEDENADTSKIELLSFGPVGVQHGEMIQFIGVNLDQVSSIMFANGTEVTAADFQKKSATIIEIVVPDAAEAGKVTLKTPQGDIVSKTVISFDVPVIIGSITAEAKPGANITISGEFINWIESVTFTSDLLVEQEDFVSQSQTELVVTVPMQAQTGFLTFTSGGTEPMSFSSAEELMVTLPVVTSLNPEAIRHESNLSIIGTDLDLVTEVDFTGGATVVAADFVSQSETEIVVNVPSTTETGSITMKQMSPVEIVTGELTIILPVGTAVAPSPAVPGVDNLTITGTDLDLVASLVLPGVGETSNFISRSETEIVLALPAEATQGAIGYVTIHGYEGPLGVIIKLPPTGNYPTLDYYIYNEGLQNGWEAWGGWGHVSQDYMNDENPLVGDLAIKTVFNDAYGAMQIHNSGAANVFDGFNYLVFYVYVEGEDSDIIVQIDNNADFYPPSFTGDKYHQIVVPLADLAGAGSVSELRIKNNNSDASTNNTTVFIDEIGLTIDEPLGPLPEIVSFIYDDAVTSPPFGVGGGWGGSTTEVDNEEQSRGGTKSVKAVFAGGWSGACQFATWGDTPLSTAGMEYFSFSIYGTDGTDGNTIQLNIKTTTDGSGTEGSIQVTIAAGKWTDYKIPFSDINNPDAIGEMQFQDTGWAGTVFIDHIGLQ
jgi:hypothetical protein